jgi:hypothetical protein
MTEMSRFQRHLKDKRMLSFVLIVITLLILNLGFSNYYLNKILNSVERTEKIMGDYNTRTRQTDTENPNCFRSEIVGRTYCGTEWNDWVKEKVYPNAIRSRIDLEVEVFKLNQIKPILFGNEFRMAIEKYTDHANAWLDLFKRVEGCSDYNCYFSEAKKPNEITTTFLIAEIKLKSVVPPIDLFKSKSRLNVIFEN